MRQTPRSRQHDIKCRLKSSLVKSIYFNHPSQGISTNCYIILGPRDKAAPPTSQQIGQFHPKPVKYRHRYPLLFLPHPQRAIFSLNQSEVRFAELGEYSQNMLSKAFWTRKHSFEAVRRKTRTRSNSKTLFYQDCSLVSLN